MTATDADTYFKIGQRHQIYQRPISQEDPEDVAELVKCLRTALHNKPLLHNNLRCCTISRRLFGNVEGLRMRRLLGWPRVVSRVPLPIPVMTSERGFDARSDSTGNDKPKDADPYDDADERSEVFKYHVGCPSNKGLIPMSKRTDPFDKVGTGNKAPAFFVTPASASAFDNAVAAFGNDLRSKSSFETETVTLSKPAKSGEYANSETSHFASSFSIIKSCCAYLVASRSDVGHCTDAFCPTKVEMIETIFAFCSFVRNLGGGSACSMARRLVAGRGIGFNGIGFNKTRTAAIATYAAIVRPPKMNHLLGVLVGKAAWIPNAMQPRPTVIKNPE